MRCAVLALLTLMLGSSFAAAQPVSPAQDAPPALPAERFRTVILVGLDGFRWDTIDRYPAPNLRKLAALGVRASLRPRFPTLTNPNFYSIVTGLNPEHHGVVSNGMYDPDLAADFDFRSWNDGRWWGGEPIWTTLQRQGGVAGVTSWIGAEAGDGARRPIYNMSYAPFAAAMTYDQRVADVFSLLDLPADRRPNLVTLYHDEVDNLAQDFGVGSKEEAQAVSSIDDMIGSLMEGLGRRGLLDHIDIVVVGDHGMVDTSDAQTIYIDDFLDAGSYRVKPATSGALMNLWPVGVSPIMMKSRLANMSPHVKVYERKDIPERFHNRGHSRTAPLLLLADEGWKICRRKDDGCRGMRALHGYDNDLVSMRATFIAAGPDFRSGETVGVVDNISVYPLLAHLLRVQAAPSDGDLCQFSGALRVSPKC